MLVISFHLKETCGIDHLWNILTSEQIHLYYYAFVLLQRYNTALSLCYILYQCYILHRVLSYISAIYYTVFYLISVLYITLCYILYQCYILHCIISYISGIYYAVLYLISMIYIALCYTLYQCYILHCVISYIGAIYYAVL